MGLSSLNRHGQIAVGKLLDIEFSPFEIGLQKNRLTLMLSLPHLVGSLGTGKTNQFHDATDNKHQVISGVPVKDNLVPGQLSGLRLALSPPCVRRLLGQVRCVRWISAEVAHGGNPRPDHDL